MPSHPKPNQKSTTASRKCYHIKDLAETKSWTTPQYTAHGDHETSVNTVEESQLSKLVQPRDVTGKFSSLASSGKGETSSSTDSNNTGGEDGEKPTEMKISRAKIRAMNRDSKRTELIQIHGNPPLPINAVQWTQEQIDEMRINTQDG